MGAAVELKGLGHYFHCLWASLVKRKRALHLLPFIASILKNTLGKYACIYAFIWMDGLNRYLGMGGRCSPSLSLSLTFNLSEVVRCWIGSFLLFIFPLFWRKCWCCCSCCCWTINLMIGFYTDETDVSFHVVIIIISQQLTCTLQ